MILTSEPSALVDADGARKGAAATLLLFVALLAALPSCTRVAASEVQSPSARTYSAAELDAAVQKATDSARSEGYASGFSSGFKQGVANTCNTIYGNGKHGVSQEQDGSVTFHDVSVHVSIGPNDGFYISKAMCLQGK